MLIDWFTVGAQALNFLILVWLMKRFLFQPILGAIDAREKGIAAKLADAAAKDAEARKAGDDFRQKSEAFDRERAALLVKATDEAKAERQRLLDEARKAADTASATRRKSLIDEARNLGSAVSRRTQEEVLCIARKMLSDLAGTGLEDRMCDVFIDRLRAMPEESRVAFAHALNGAPEPARVRSAFDLPAAQRTTIQKAFSDTFPSALPLRFETAPDLVCGIELGANGQRVAWSISDYLGSLEQAIGELVSEKDSAEGEHPPVAETGTRQQ